MVALSADAVQVSISSGRQDHHPIDIRNHGRAQVCGQINLPQEGTTAGPVERIPLRQQYLAPSIGVDLRQYHTCLAPSRVAKLLMLCQMQTGISGKMIRARFAWVTPA